MAEQMRPSSKKNAPDPAIHFDRSKPENEAGMGRLDNNKAVPANSRDKMDQAVANKQDPTHQVNAEDIDHLKHEGKVPSSKQAAQPADHSMKDEEPLGEDAAPQDIHDPRRKRHPRTGGKGGTPDAGERTSKG
jgi:hypothetical protein